MGLKGREVQEPNVCSESRLEGERIGWGMTKRQLGEDRSKGNSDREEGLEVYRKEA